MRADRFSPIDRRGGVGGCDAAPRSSWPAMNVQYNVQCHISPGVVGGVDGSDSNNMNSRGVDV
jgi:hypothetical protein